MPAQYAISPTKIPLDYGPATRSRLLGNISGAASVGDLLWTVSDEGRTVECLRTSGAGYALAEQFQLDELFPSLPGHGTTAELDLESIDIADDHVWICGSHSLVRSKLGLGLAGSVEHRPGRNFLAKIELLGDGSRLGVVQCLPSDGPGSLRQLLANDTTISPFLGLPCKENGLDIEGIAVASESPMLGFRGPVIDGHAVILSLQLNEAFQIYGHEIHLLDLGGLGIRDLTRRGDDLLIIAGPVGEERAPFRLYLWRPEPGAAAPPPTLLFEWPVADEKPEGLCPMVRNGETGILVVFDSPTAGRIFGGTYSADWMTERAPQGLA